MSRVVGCAALALAASCSSGSPPRAARTGASDAAAASDVPEDAAVMARWDDAKADLLLCYVGESPVTTDLRDAIAIAHPDRAPTCERAIESARAAVPQGAHGGAIEAALDALARVENEYPATAAALVAFDDAARALLPAGSPAPRPRPLPTLALSPPIPGTEHGRVAERFVDAVFSWNELTVWLEVDERVRTVYARPDEPPEVTPRVPWIPNARPGGAWGAELRGGTAVAGALTPTGGVADEAVAIAPDLGHPVAALGAGDARAVVAPRKGKLQFVTSTDGGRTWRARPIPDGKEPAHRYDRQHALDVFWPEPGKGTGARWLHLSDPSVMPRVRRVPAPGMVEVQCIAEVLWFTSEAELYRLDGAKPVLIETVNRMGDTLFQPKAWGCTRDAIAIELNFRLYLCTIDGCDEEGFEIPAYTDGKGTLLGGDRVAFAVLVDRVVGVWRSDAAAPTFHRVPDGTSLVALLGWGGQPHLVLLTPAGLSITPVAAP